MAAFKRGLGACLLACGLAACAQSPVVPYSSAPVGDIDIPVARVVVETGRHEVVVVINSNIKMVHAGMFAGSRLFDPAGSYENTRRDEPGWLGPGLADYVRFQLDDGPDVKLYRFKLAPQAFGEVISRIEEAGSTPPLFCAARVQSVITGIGPFASLSDSWLMHPASLAVHLDGIIIAGNGGSCAWPDGRSCYLAVEGSPIVAEALGH